MSVTIEDVAEAADVSTATVSRVINTPERVRPKTRQKVEAVIQELGYKPNYFAQGLMKGCTNSVGIITSVHINPYFIEIIGSIEHILSQSGVYIYLCNCERNPDLEQEYTQELIRRNIDALIVIESPSLNNGENYFTPRRFDCPVILINQHRRPYGDHYVIRCDQTPGLMDALNYIRDNQLFPFLLLNSSEDHYSYNFKEKLLRKWRKDNSLSQEDAGSLRADTLLDMNDTEAVRKTCEVVKKVLLSPARPRSILAANDLMAIGVLTAARELSIAVPDELAVAGVDNIFLSQFYSPPLTTVDLRMNDVGTMAAELYLALRQNPEKEQPKLQVIPSCLKMRATL